MKSVRKSYAHLEERYTTLRSSHSGEYYRCFFCGDPADTLDHCPPISRVSDYEALGLARERYLKVPCCSECNRLAGATLQASLVERAEFVKDKLEKKLRKHLRTPDWDPEELAEMGPGLRIEIERAGRLRDRARQRIEHYDDIDWFLAQEDS